MKQRLRDAEFGVLGLFVGVVAGFALGALVVYGLHKQHWLGDPQPRKVAAFSEVPRGQAGELAQRFRPWLRFDTQEQWRPLNIHSLLEEQTGGASSHEFCRRVPTGAPDCSPIAGEDGFRAKTDKANALGGGATFINLAGSKLDDYRGPSQCGIELDCGDGSGSAIYYHVTRSNDRFYVDFWWYLRFNHFYRSDPQVSCKVAAFRANGVCDEHEGDWEGVTVVTPPGDDKQIDYVVYAAHKGTFRYVASELGLHGGTRPDVYLARGSHAAYPTACDKKCHQPIAVQGLVDLPESSFDGKASWERNGDACVAGEAGSCLLPLPRTDEDPQAWTVWPGQWGAGCGDACGKSPGASSPQSPGLQARYQTPWCSSQRGSFTCDGVALGCSDWLGPLVAAVVCDPAALDKGLRASKEKATGNLALTVKGEQRTKESTPGVVQALGDPLVAGDTVTVSGNSPGAQVLVRAQQGKVVAEARFDNLGLAPGRTAVVTVTKGRGGPAIRIGTRRPVELRTRITE